MRKELMNYESLLKITREISLSRDPGEVVFPIVESVSRALESKGCVLFLFNRKTNELEVAASYGLSDEYLNKGPISSLRSLFLMIDSPRFCSPLSSKKYETWTFKA